MKKTAMKISGNITMILFFLLLLVSVVGVCAELEVTAVTDFVYSNEILSSIATFVFLIFITIPIYLLGLTGLTLPAEITMILVFAFAAFCLLMFLWGIKEITLSGRDDERFAKCKVTCAFMNFTKFMFFAYMLAVIILSVLDEEVSLLTLAISELLNVPYIFLIVTSVLALFAFVIFVLPVANISVVYNNVKYNESYEQPQQYAQPDAGVANNDSQELQSFYTQAPQPTMQANMPPMPGYNPQVVVQTTAQPQPAVQPVQQPMAQPQPMPQPQQYAQPVQPQVATQPAMQPQPTAGQPAQGGIVPGQDGVPVNITEKGLADLQRLERLKSMGAITPENYAAMKQKICSTNIG